jgi:hypothetical protein
MSIIEFKYHELDSAIDERIERSNNIRDEWGSVIFDSEGRLKSSEDFPLEPHTLLGIIQYQQEQITELVDVQNIFHASNTKYIMELEENIKCLTVSDGVNSNAIEMLLERVKILEKEVEKL